MSGLAAAEARYLIARAKGIAIAKDFFFAGLPDGGNIRAPEYGVPASIDIVRRRTELLVLPHPELDPA